MIKYNKINLLQIILMMLSNSQSRQARVNSKNSDNQRSTTPNKQKQLHFGINPRQSKSLARPPTSSNTMFPVSNSELNSNQSGLKAMEPISELFESMKYYYLGRGNNHQVIKRILSLRKNMVENNNSQFHHFKWTQNSFGFKYHKLGKECISFNHFEFHREISNKQRLVWNLINFCQSNKLNAFTYVPTTYIIDLTTGEEDLALHSFLKFYNRNIPEGYTGSKVNSIILPRTKFIPYFSPQQLHKRSQGNFYCKPTCPKTFFSDSHAYLWILKPTFMNRGRGVSLFNSLGEFQKLIWKYYEGEGLEDYQDKQGIGDLYKLESAGTSENAINTVRIFTNEDDQNTDKQKQQKKTEIKVQQKIKIEQKAQVKSQQVINSSAQSSNQQKNAGNNLRVLSFIVQKYIECPFLINQRKFDIRVWALLTQNYEVYFFKEGYLRFSSHKYSTEHHTNPFIHLTNNSVQKHCNEYNQESGNQISLSDMKQYIGNQTVYSKIQTKIREIIWMTMSSVRRKINVNGRKDCFQVFGYDFMIDSAFKVWLIEVNTNPAIQECSNVLKKLIPRMIDDMFKLTVDKILNLSYKSPRQIFEVDGFSNEDNMWELLGDFREGVNEKTMGKNMVFVRR